jgi:hypothetical protein
MQGHPDAGEMPLDEGGDISRPGCSTPALKKIRKKGSNLRKLDL